MNCYFCQQPAELEFHGYAFEYFRCKSCHTEICRARASDSLEYVRFDFEYKNAGYALILNFHRQDCCLECHYPKANPRLVFWDFIPNLTPQNIQNKIQTILTFS